MTIGVRNHRGANHVMVVRTDCQYRLCPKRTGCFFAIQPSGIAEMVSQCACEVSVACPIHPNLGRNGVGWVVIRLLFHAFNFGVQSSQYTANQIAVCFSGCVGCEVQSQDVLHTCLDTCEVKGLLASSLLASETRTKELPHQSTHPPLQRTIRFTCRAACKCAVSRKTVVAARSSATAGSL